MGHGLHVYPVEVSERNYKSANNNAISWTLCKLKDIAICNFVSFDKAVILLRRIVF